MTAPHRLLLLVALALLAVAAQGLTCKPGFYERQARKGAACVRCMLRGCAECAPCEKGKGSPDCQGKRRCTVTCQDTNCQVCGGDAAKCKLCKKGFKKDATGVCVARTDCDTGKGRCCAGFFRNLETRECDACDISNCDDCRMCLMTWRPICQTVEGYDNVARTCTVCATGFVKDGAGGCKAA